MESVLLNNRYRLLELVGSGGMAVVYKALDTFLERYVAVKMLREAFASDPAFLARFQREARAAARLDHPNVVTVYDVGEDNGRHYIVMEYVDGQDLKSLIRQRENLTVQQTLDITIQICAGVGHAHKANLIHCDIKPQNVLVTRDGRAKVTDFGIARALSETGLTESETVWGSPLYFSPEQAAGEPPTPASDVYSIGIILYEMLSGAPPFQAEKPTALALKHIREEPPPLSTYTHQVPPQLDWIVRKLLAKEPSARYRTAEQVVHVLSEYRSQSEQRTGYQPVTPAASQKRKSAGAKPDEPSPESRQVSSRLTWSLGAIAFVAVVGLIPLYWPIYQYLFATPPIPPTPTPTIQNATPVPTTELVQVPDVLEIPAEQAQQSIAQAGLRVVSSQRHEPDKETGIVLEQNPQPGDMVPAGSQVAIVICARSEMTMPTVTSYTLDLVQEGLESDGLIVIVEEIWSTEDEGLVIAQTPEPGTVIQAGDVITLSVSGGLKLPIPLNVNLGDMILLESAELGQETFQPGGMIAVTVRWQAIHSIASNYRVFLHLQDMDGPHSTPVAYGDADPRVPTSQWTPGVQIVDPHSLVIPADQPPGTYQLRIGLYAQSTGSRVPVVDPGSTPVELNSILIAEIEVVP